MAKNNDNIQIFRRNSNDPKYLDQAEYQPGESANSGSIDISDDIQIQIGKIQEVISEESDDNKLAERMSLELNHAHKKIQVLKEEYESAGDNQNKKTDIAARLLEIKKLLDSIIQNSKLALSQNLLEDASELKQYLSIWLEQQGLIATQSHASSAVNTEYDSHFKQVEAPVKKIEGLTDETVQTLARTLAETYNNIVNDCNAESSPEEKNANTKQMAEALENFRSFSKLLHGTKHVFAYEWAQEQIKNIIYDMGRRVDIPKEYEDRVDTVLKAKRDEISVIHNQEQMQSIADEIVINFIIDDNAKEGTREEVRMRVLDKLNMVDGINISRDGNTEKIVVSGPGKPEGAFEKNGKLRLFILEVIKTEEKALAV